MQVEWENTLLFTLDHSGVMVRGAAAQSESAQRIRKEDDMKILMVLTSHDQLGNTGRKTGFWLEE